MPVAKEIEIAPGALPLIGHAIPLLRDPLGFLTSLQRHGDLVRIKVGPWSAVVLCDLQLTRQVLMDDRTFDKGGPIYERIRDALGDNLASCAHQDHRRQRRLVQPAFHDSRLARYADVMTEQVAERCGQWVSGREVDVFREMLQITARILVTGVFNALRGTLSLDTMIDDATTILEGIYVLAVVPRKLAGIPVPGTRRYERAALRLRARIADLVSGYRGSGADEGDLVSMLLAAKDDGEGGSGSALTDVEVVEQVMTVFIAGIESTAGLLGWALHLLAEHPDVERELHSEVDDVLAGRAATIADLPNLGLVNRVVVETMRLYPPAWLLTRSTTTDTVLGGHTVPRGTAVIYSAYTLQRQESRYVDQDRFDPSRWLGDAKTMRNGPFPAFGGGARQCIGNRFALTEMSLVLSTVAARWRFVPVPGTRVRPALGLDMYPKGLRMRIEARNVEAGNSARLSD